MRVLAIIAAALGLSLQAEPVFRLSASDGAYPTVFGDAVAACGDYAIVGAGDGSKATNAYIYHRTAAGWVEEAKLVTSAHATNTGKFGHSVAMGKDYAVVGARGEYQGAGRVYVYQRSGTNWNPVATFIPPKLVPEPPTSPYFGQAVAAHGDLIAVGAPLGTETLPGSVFLYRRIAGAWQFEVQLSTTNGSFMFRCGWDVAVCGDTVAMLGQVVQSADVTGRGVVIWQKSATMWSPSSYLIHSQRYYADNARVALTTNSVILGDPGATNASGEVTGAVFLFNAAPQGWGWTPLRLHEDVKFAGARSSEAFGASVAIDGEIAVVGAPGFPRANVLRRNAGVWQSHSSLKVLPWRDLSYFGQAVATSGGRVFVGAPRDTEYFEDAYGAVYVFGALSPAPAYGPTPAHDWNWAQYGVCSPLLPTNSVLAWSNGDPSTSVDLYLNPGESPTNKVLNNVVPVSIYSPEALQPNRLYSWQVVNRNAYGETAGPVWHFGTTGALDFAVSPANVPFGSVATNTGSTPRVVTIENPGPRLIEVDLRLVNPAFWVQLEAEGTPTNFADNFTLILPGGARENLLVVFAPTSATHYEDTVSLVSFVMISGALPERRTNFVSLSGDGIVPTAGAPSNPNPPNGSMDQSPDTDLRWQNGTATTTMDLLVSRSGQPLAYLLSNTAPAASYALPRLLYDTTYQWQVVCRSGGGNTPGPVWTFKTLHPLLEVASPNGREAWRVGTTRTITWMAKNGADTVQLDLCVLDPNGHLRRVSVLATNLPAGAGNFAWNIDPHLEPGEGYFIRVRDEWDLSCFDQSDGPFALTPTIHLVHPNGGEPVRADAPCNLSWLGEELGGEVRLDILQNGGDYLRFGRAPNTGSFVWNVPCDLAAKGLQARVVWLGDESLNDLSDGTFDVAILPPDQASNPSPADRAENVSRTPTLTWTNGAGTCEVEVWLGLENPPTELGYSGVLTNRFPVTHALRPEAAHFWRVVAHNHAGATNGPVWRFVTMAEIQSPRLAMPTCAGNHLQFQWTPHQSGMQYRLQCTTNLGVAFTDVMVVQTNRCTHTNALAGPRRYYRLRAEPLP